MAIWKKKRACRTEKHNIRVWSYSSSPIEERMLHSGLVPDPFTSSLYFFLAFGTGCLFYFELKCWVLSIISPKSIRFMPLCCLRDKKQMCVCSVDQLCPTLCNPMDCSLPDSSVHGIFQARILEWVAIPFSRASSQPRAQTWVFCISLH